MSQSTAIRRRRQARIDPRYSLQKAKGRKKTSWKLVNGIWMKNKAAS